MRIYPLLYICIFILLGNTAALKANNSEDETGRGIHEQIDDPGLCNICNNLKNYLTSIPRSQYAKFFRITGYSLLGIILFNEYSNLMLLLQNALESSNNTFNDFMNKAWKEEEVPGWPGECFEQCSLKDFGTFSFETQRKPFSEECEEYGEMGWFPSKRTSANFSEWFHMMTQNCHFNSTYWEEIVRRGRCEMKWIKITEDGRYIELEPGMDIRRSFISGYFCHPNPDGQSITCGGLTTRLEEKGTCLYTADAFFTGSPQCAANKAWWNEMRSYPLVNLGCYLYEGAQFLWLKYDHFKWYCKHML